MVFDLHVPRGRGNEVGEKDGWSLKYERNGCQVLYGSGFVRRKEGGVFPLLFSGYAVMQKLISLLLMR